MYHGEIPKYEIDHKNRDRADNRISNLRDIPHSENRKNSKVYNTNTSGHTGVHFDKNRNMWMASIQVDHILIHLGRFITNKRPSPFEKKPR
jgi:hypothetical protein